uniref:AB hydrolase-1 domain-containing protein n=1 Tax=Globodera rostochiensis TaxID=31243 RepID=A0A914HUW3_GLORO
MQFVFSLAPSFEALLASPGYAIFFIFLLLIARFLKLTSFDEKPRITRRKNKRQNSSRKCSEEDDQCAKIDLGELFGQCSILQEPYTPPAIWGRNGHIQTMAYGLLGHHSLRRTFDNRHLLRLLDGTTATFDVFEPVCAHQNGGDFTLVFCPGIANCSESNYIRTCVHLVQEKAYFTEDFFIWRKRMGANVLTNCFAGLDREICSRVLLGISVCQGYCASDGASLLFDWEGGRRLYNYIITENLKRLLRRNYTMAVQPYVRTGLVDEQKLWSSTSLLWFDECYSRRVHNFTSDIKIPMIFVNTLDDPLVPEALWDPVRQLCESHPLHSFVLLKHGGHLGFLEGNSLRPRSVTWLDRFILEMAEAARAHVEQSEMSATGTSFEEASE